MKIYRWKFLQKGFKSENGNVTWKKGVWNKIDEPLKMCEMGFHCSKDPYDAFSYVQGEILAKVECRGKHLEDDNKECWSEQRIVKAYKWTKKNSVALAIFAAELILPNFEKAYPNDKRPRKAIEAAKKVLFKDTAKNRLAARTSAWLAWEASQSLWEATESLLASAWLAWASAGSARTSAQLAWTATWASAGSARAASWSETIKKIQSFFLKQVKSLEEI